MSLNAAEKAEIVEKVTGEMKLAKTDTGSPEVQVALMSEQIKRLTDHLKGNKQDVHSRHGLTKLVSKRRRLLDYLKRTQLERYQQLLALLGLRK